MIFSSTRKGIALDTVAVLVAVEGGDVLGYVFAREESYPPVFELSRHASLFDMAVRADARGRGIGTALLAAVEDWARGRRLTRLELRVSVYNPEGRRFWANRGFTDYLAVAAKEL